MSRVRAPTAPVFDVQLLEQLLQEAGIDLLAATSLHNVQYLLGGYRFFFHAEEDAIGMSKYLPVLGYVAERPQEAFYVGNPLEVDQQAFEPLWTPAVLNTATTARAAAAALADRVEALGLARGTIGVELPFLPAEAYLTLVERLPEARFVDVVDLLSELRAIKRPDEQRILLAAGDAIVDSMLACFARAYEGVTTAELEQMMREEESARGMRFEYCLTTTGLDCNRAPSATRRWAAGEGLSLDSGASLHGYIGDLARMAVLGEPSALQRELLEEVDAIQAAARAPVKAGAPGAAVDDAVDAALASSPNGPHVHFLVHGYGMINHEAPRISKRTTLGYAPKHRELPLRAGMVLSLETTLTHPEAGFVKLEDAVIVTDDGCTPIGDRGRGWNVVG